MVKKSPHTSLVAKSSPCFLEACNSFHFCKMIAFSSRVVADGYCTQRKCFMWPVNWTLVVALSASGGRSERESASDSSAPAPPVSIWSPLSGVLLSLPRKSYCMGTEREFKVHLLVQAFSLTPIIDNAGDTAFCHNYLHVTIVLVIQYACMQVYKTIRNVIRVCTCTVVVVSCNQQPWMNSLSPLAIS